MHRRPLLELLDRYREKHPGEGACIDRIVDLVADHQNCFERDCLPGHITASSWIVSHDFEHCLLTHHRKLDRWLQLGGHADGENDVLETALREAREESGMERFEVMGNGSVPLDVDVHVIPPHGHEPAHEHHDIRFLLVAASDQPLRISSESHDLRWFRRQEMPSLLTEESVLRLERKAAVWLARN